MSDCEFEVDKNSLADFKQNGYIIVRKLFDVEEIEKFKKCFEGSRDIYENNRIFDDGLQEHGRMVKNTTWFHPGNDVTGMAARSEKVVNTVEKLLEADEVYHYHGKLIQKNAKTGGTYLWHQDYGYWYKSGCLFPDMLTVFVAIDKCDKENGCLKVLAGSHKCGRISHNIVSSQTAADIDRVRALKKVLPLVHVELDPGDALFFHCNVLHCSGSNKSDRRRWAYLMAYNTRKNNPTKTDDPSCYSPLIKVPNSAIKECKNYGDLTGKAFWNPIDGRTTTWKD